MISQQLRLTLIQGITLTGGLTSGTIFPKTEAKLHQTEYQKALKFVARKKYMERYHSMMDFLFCESFTQWRFHAFKFYNGEGPRFIDEPLLDDIQQEMYDVLMCDGILELCIISLNDERWVSWDAMKKQFEIEMLLADAA